MHTQVQELSCKHNQIRQDAVVIVGAGRFGSRAARILSQKTNSRILVVDMDKGPLCQLSGLSVERISCDGIRFLVDNCHLLGPKSIIVPALPVHLAFEWIKAYLAGKYQIEMISVPEKTATELPHTWEGTEGSLLISYADFRCPDDCPEPEFCTVTGEHRVEPLHDLLTRLDLPGFRVHVIRSRQLAPGLGGFSIADLFTAAEKLTGDRPGKWVLGTGCKCHGVLTAFEIHLFGESRKGKLDASTIHEKQSLGRDFSVLCLS
jgi:hypothetical protein